MTQALPPFAALRAFEATARHLSLRLAAQELHVTQSAVSHQIKVLQSWLGADLLTRQGRGVALTPTGQQLALRLGSLLEQMAQAVADARPDPAPQRVCVSVLPSFAAKWLLPRLPGFMAAHPDIELAIDARMELVDLARERIDIALRYGRGDWPGVQALRLMGEDMLVVCSVERVDSPTPWSVEKVLRQPLLRDQSQQSWQDWCTAAGATAPAPDAAMVFNDASMLIQATLGGHGLALVRSVLVQDDLAAGRLVRVSACTIAASFSYFAVTRLDRPLSPNAATFLAWVQAQAYA